MPLTIVENNVRIKFRRENDSYILKLVDKDYMEEVITVPSEKFPLRSKLRGNCEIPAQWALELGFKLIYVWEVEKR